MSYATAVYTEQGGATLVIGPGGTLNATDGTVILPAGSVATAKIAAGAVTPSKLSTTGLKKLTAAGRNGAGAVTLSGTVVGDRVLVITGGPTAGGTPVFGDAAFEATVTVADQIQQSSGSDLSGNTYLFVLIPPAS